MLQHLAQYFRITGLFLLGGLLLFLLIRGLFQ